MSKASDAHFWDRTSRKYARSKIADQPGYERSLDRTRALLGPGAKVLELGCGTGSTALRLAGDVQGYLATDISSEMIVIAREKLTAHPVPGLQFRVATVEVLTEEPTSFDAVLGFNYLHLVRELPDTLRRIHDLLTAGGLFVSKTPCLGDMNLAIRMLVPLMQAVGQAPHVSVFRSADLSQKISAAGFDVLAHENHDSNGGKTRPFIVARKR